MVDANIIVIRAAVEISYLTEEKQDSLINKIEIHNATVSLAQTIRLKQYAQAGEPEDEI